MHLGRPVRIDQLGDLFAGERRERHREGSVPPQLGEADGDAFRRGGPRGADDPPGRPADQEDTSGWPVLHGQAGGQDTQLIAPADERGIRRDGGHAFSIAQSPYQVSVPWFSGRTDAPARPAGDAGGMDISMHTQPSTHPVKTGWVDHALADANAAGTPSAC